MAASAYCHAQRHFQGWAAQDDTHRAKGVRLAWRAVELVPNDAQVLWMAAFAVWNLAEEGREAARELFSRSLMINPNSAMALTLGGWIETMRGEDYPGAVTWAEKALGQNRRFAVALRVLAVALVKLGQRDRAARVVREMLTIEPELTISGFLTRIPVPLESMATTYAEALRAAGLPE